MPAIAPPLGEDEGASDCDGGSDCMAWKELAGVVEEEEDVVTLNGRSVWPA
jgi:hypothetical protein